MGYYAKYFIKTQTGKVIERLGSDGFYRLDGRLSVFRMKAEAIQQANRLKNICRMYAYDIMEIQNHDIRLDHRSMIGLTIL